MSDYLLPEGHITKLKSYVIDLEEAVTAVQSAVTDMTEKEAALFKIGFFAGSTKALSSSMRDMIDATKEIDSLAKKFFN